MLTRNEITKIYQRAIDRSAGAGEGESWWDAVHSEIDAVVAAPTKIAAAEIISWWHPVWSDVHDTPVRAAGRIRTQAARVLATRPGRKDQA